MLLNDPCGLVVIVFCFSPGQHWMLLSHTRKDEGHYPIHVHCIPDSKFSRLLQDAVLIDVYQLCVAKRSVLKCRLALHLCSWYNPPDSSQHLRERVLGSIPLLFHLVTYQKPPLKLIQFIMCCTHDIDIRYAGFYRWIVPMHFRCWAENWI